MKRFLLFSLVATMFAACVTDATQDVAVEISETLTVSFEEDSRIQLQDGKTVWTKGDLASVFYRSNANQKWQYQGETGERTGNLKRVSAGSATQTMQRVVVVYPYNENYYLNTETYNVEASLPATQHYLEDSYGLDGNILISQSEYNQFSLKSVCGWLKIQLKGEGQTVKTITLKGNNGEQVAGQIYINSADATAILASEMGSVDEGENGAGGNLIFDDTILKEVTLDCGEGVTLGSEATAFYIALPPQTFENGFTIDIEATDGSKMTKSTPNAIVIERNTIKPMSVLEGDFEQPMPNNEIRYTTRDGQIVTPYNAEAFGVAIVSNTYENGKGVIKFDGDVASIGESAFRECYNLKSVTIPSSVTSIGYAAFSNCSFLTSVTIPDSVTEIGSRAFYYCSFLTSITIPDSVISIKQSAFSGCSRLVAFNSKYVSADNRCLVIDGVLNSFAPSGLTEYTIPNGVTSIGCAAFSTCSRLTNITIPESVTSIGRFAFEGCSNLSSITIPDSVTSIEYGVFKNCRSLTSFNSKFASADKRCLVIDGVLNSFAPSGLTEYTILDGITSIEMQVFAECTSLTSVTIPDSVTAIGQSVFFNCHSLTSITIPENVTSIGSFAFDYCRSLIGIYCKPTTPPTGGQRMFYDNAEDRKIYVPTASVDAYKAARYWSEYKSYIEGYDFNIDAITKKAQGWAEMPKMVAGDNLEYCTHDKLPSNNELRNYSFCFDKEKHCALWVAYPLHSCYTEGSGERTDAWCYDPCCVEDKYEPYLKNSYYSQGGSSSSHSRGHQLPSADRLASNEDNATTFYYTNMTPQLQSFNSGVWASLESNLRSKHMCSDTLYVVTGAHFDDGHGYAYDNKGAGKACAVPTHYYKVILRTKSGNSGKWVGNCSASELKCVGFWFEHESGATQQMMSVAEIEEKTGHTFFPNVPNAPKTTYSTSEW